MKKLFIILLVIASIAKQSKAQPYQSLFGSTSTSWNTLFCGGANCAAMYDSVWALNDTMINALHYKQIHNLMGCGFGGFLREDTIAGKTWFKGKVACYPYPDTAEHLIMDLNLTITDSVFINLYGGMCDIGSGWRKVDSVYFLSGKKHIRLNCITGVLGDKITFIEGIGSNIFAQIYGGGNGCPYVFCSYKNGSQVYITPYPGYCGSAASIHTTTILQADVSIYPHPVSNNSTLSFSNQNHSKFFLDIYTVNGAKITSFNTKSDSFILQKQGFADGIYFYHLYDAENNTSIYNKIMFIN